MADEMLVVKREGPKMKFKVVDKKKNEWAPKRYQKIIANKDPNLLAYLFWDLKSMNYNVDLAYTKYKEMQNRPDLFFL